MKPVLEVKTLNFVVSDRRGRKLMERMLQDGWTVQTTTKTAFTRASTIVFSRPRPLTKRERRAADQIDGPTA